MVPNRDSLLVMGAEDVQGLTIMLDLAAKALEQPRPMPPLPLRRVVDDWEDWMPGQDHPLRTRFADLARKYFLDTYTDQKNLLDRLNEKTANDIFVAAYILIKKEDGRLFSYSTWADGVKTLLPKTEWIALGRVNEGVAAIAPWEKAEELVSRLMQKTEHYPERFLIESFPTAAELASLGKAKP